MLKLNNSIFFKHANHYSNHNSKSFPSNTEKNPKDCIVVTLWSGKEHGDSKEVEGETVETEKEDDRVEKKEEKKEEYKFTLGRILFPDNPSPITPPL